MNNLFLSLTYDLHTYQYEITLLVMDERCLDLIAKKHYPPFVMTDESILDNLDSEIQSLIEENDVEYVYTFGDHEILHSLKSLTTVSVIDIRNSHIDENRIIDVNLPCNSDSGEECGKPPQPCGIKILPDVVESINNLCFLISKNIVHGYDKHNECIRFNQKRSDEAYTVILSEINAIRIMILKCARGLLRRVNYDYDVVEFILQCVFLNLAYPHFVTYSSSSSSSSFDLEIFINDIRVISVTDYRGYILHRDYYNVYVKEIRGLVSIFNTDVLQLDRVKHDKFLTDRIKKICKDI